MAPHVEYEGTEIPNTRHDHNDFLAHYDVDHELINNASTVLNLNTLDRIREFADGVKEVADDLGDVCDSRLVEIKFNDRESATIKHESPPTSISANQFYDDRDTRSD